jgi:acyl-CoA synthetase (AMP-forming)/AMP-acid ligase II
MRGLGLERRRRGRATKRRRRRDSRCADRYTTGVNVWQILTDAAHAFPERIVLREGARAVTCGGALALAERLGAFLHARGVAPGDRVASLLQNGIDHWLAYFAAAACGAVLVPLNTRLSAGEQRTILAHAEAVLLMHDAAFAARADELRTDLREGATGVAAAIAAAGAAPFFATPAIAEAPAHLYYTSGTTGRPKGVILTHRNVCTHARAAVQELSLASNDRWAHIAPMFHLADAWAVFAITLAGGEHVFLPQFSPAAALDLLAHERVTITNLVPTMLALMVAEPDASDRDYGLRVMLSGGAPIAPAVVRAVMDTFRCDYVQTYGMTETSPYLTLSLLSPELRRLPPERQLHWKCKTGRPFLGVELRVVAEAGRPVAADGVAVGEIRVRGPTVTKGYWRDAAATAAAFDDEGFLRTGDLATIDEHGYVDIKDRSKDVVKTGGEAVYSTEVEAVLHQHPAVLECAVFGRPDPIWGEIVAAAVVLRPALAATEAELIAFCRERIAHYKAPRQVRFLEALPKTGSGKIQKRTLREQAG